MANPAIVQRAVRYRNDDGGIGATGAGGASWASTENGALSRYNAVGNRFRMRVQMDETANKTNSWSNATWQVRTRPDSGSGWGSWATFAATTGPVAGTTSTNVSDGTAIGAQLLSNAPVGSYESEGNFQAAGGAPGDWAFTKDNFSEWESIAYFTTGATTGWQAQFRLLPTNYASTGSNVVATVTSLGTTGAGATVYSTSHSLDAALQRQGLLVTHNVDAALQKRIVLAGAEEETGTLFVSGYEGEDDNFTTTWTQKFASGSNTMLVEQTDPRTGDDHARATFDGTNNTARHEKHGLGSKTEMYTRVYFKINASWGQNNTTNICISRTSGGARVWAVRIGGSASPWTLSVLADGAVGTPSIGPSASFSTGAWHWFEVHYKEDTDGTDGELQLWVDGTSVGSLSNIDWNSNTIDRLDVGVSDSNIPTSSSVLDFEDVRCEETGPLGAFTPAGMVADAVLAVAGSLQASLAAVLQKVGTATTDIDGVLQRQGLLATTDIDGVLQRQGLLATTDIDAVLAALGMVTTDIDAFLQGITAVDTDVDAALQAVLTVAHSLDAALQAVLTATTDIDAVLAMLQTVQTAVDAALQLRRTATTDIDAALLRAKAATTDIDAALQAGHVSQTVVDAILSLGQSLQTAVDAVLQKRGTATTDVDAALQAVLSVATGVNAYLVAAGANLLLTDVDAALQRQGLTVDTDVDAALLRVLAVTTNIDAYIVSIAGAMLTADVDAALQRVFSADTNVDAALEAARTATTNLDAYLIAVGAGMVQTQLNAALQTRAILSTDVSAGLAERLALQTAMNASIKREQERVAWLGATLQRELLAWTYVDARIRSAFLPAGLPPSARVQPIPGRNKDEPTGRSGRIRSVER